MNARDQHVLQEALAKANATLGYCDGSAKHCIIVFLEHLSEDMNMVNVDDVEAGRLAEVLRDIDEWA